jgi:hypothetical protein
MRTLGRSSRLDYPRGAIDKGEFAKAATKNHNRPIRASGGWGLRPQTPIFLESMFSFSPAIVSLKYMDSKNGGLGPQAPAAGGSYLF